MPRRRRWTARRSWQWRSRPRWRTPRTTRTTMRRRTTRTTVRAVGGAPARGWLACAAALQWGSGAECREHRRRDAQQGLCACFGPGSQAVPNWAWLSGRAAWSLAPRPCRIKPGSQAVPQACNALCSHCIPVLRWNRYACCICGRAPGSEHCWVELPQNDSCRRLAPRAPSARAMLPSACSVPCAQHSLAHDRVAGQERIRRQAHHTSAGSGQVPGCLTANSMLQCGRAAHSGGRRGTQPPSVSDWSPASKGPADKEVTVCKGVLAMATATRALNHTLLVHSNQRIVPSY